LVHSKYKKKVLRPSIRKTLGTSPEDLRQINATNILNIPTNEQPATPTNEQPAIFTNEQPAIFANGEPATTTTFSSSKKKFIRVTMGRIIISTIFFVNSLIVYSGISWADVQGVHVIWDYVVNDRSIWESLVKLYKIRDKSGNNPMIEIIRSLVTDKYEPLKDKLNQLTALYYLAYQYYKDIMSSHGASIKEILKSFFTLAVMIIKNIIRTVELIYQIIYEYIVNFFKDPVDSVVSESMDTASEVKKRATRQIETSNTSLRAIDTEKYCDKQESNVK